MHRVVCERHTRGLRELGGRNRDKSVASDAITLSVRNAVRS